MNPLLKKAIAGALGLVITLVVGLVAAGVAVLYPPIGTFMQAAVLGGIVVLFGLIAYGAGKAFCEKVFGWFF